MPISQIRLVDEKQIDPEMECLFAFRKRAHHSNLIILHSHSAQDTLTFKYIKWKTSTYYSHYFNLNVHFLFL